jgi:hypothetical protein
MSTDIQKRIKSLSSTNKPSSKVKGLGISNKIELLHSSEVIPYNTIGRIESDLHNLYSDKRYTGMAILPNGNSELFIDIKLETFKRDLAEIVRN